MNIVVALLALVVFGGGWLVMGWFAARSDLHRILAEQDTGMRYLRAGGLPVLRCGPDCSGHQVLDHAVGGEKT